MTEFVAYYRVSTDRQGASGLGLDAQRQAVERHIAEGGQLAGEFTEIESGRRHSNRPELAAALDECRKRRAVLLIARLDRLARNVHFISGLIESGVRFHCCDNPHATKTMLQMLAVFAEYEREMISKRTKDALAQAKARGTQLGNPRLAEAREIAQAAHHARRPVPEIRNLMSGWRAEGKTLREIAQELNRLGIGSPRGKAWYASSVSNLLKAVA